MEQKKRQPVLEQAYSEDDTTSTKDGVLHEEVFHEHTKDVTEQNGHHDVETAPAGASQTEQGVFDTLKIVDWWKVSHMHMHIRMHMHMHMHMHMQKPHRTGVI